MLVNATAMLQSAEKGHYGIGAFNTNNLEWASSILDAGEELQSPLIIQCTSGAAKWQTSFKLVADMVKDLVEAKNITVPVALHLDHGSYEAALECIDAGFTSVMYDGSHEKDFETNLAHTAEIVKLAHSKGISVEAEVGGIGGTEDGVTAKGELADPEQCKAIADLGVDFLACGIGNIHGIYPANWEGLSFDRLQEIKAKTGDLPLVLHGGTRIRSRRPSPWASPRSTSTPTSSWSSLPPPASTSRRASTSRARATIPASSSSPVARPSRSAPRSSSRSLAPTARAGTNGSTGSAPRVLLAA